MPPEGGPCPDTPCQNAQEYGVPETLTETVPPLVSGETQKLYAFVGLVFSTLTAAHHSADCCVAENGYRKNGDTYDDWIVGHFFLYFFLVSINLRTPNLFTLPKTFLRTLIIEPSKLFIIPLVFIRVNTETKDRTFNSVA